MPYHILTQPTLITNLQELQNINTNLLDNKNSKSPASAINNDDQKMLKVIQDLQAKLQQEYEKQMMIEHLLKQDNQNSILVGDILSILQSKPSENKTMVEDAVSQEISIQKRMKNNTNQLRTQNETSSLIMKVLPNSVSNRNIQSDNNNDNNYMSQYEQVHSNSQINIPDNDNNLLQSHQRKFNNYTGIENDKSQRDASKNKSVNTDFSSNLTRILPSYIASQIRKDLIQSKDEDHICQLLKQIRELLKKACQESRKSRKEAFKYIFISYDLLSLSQPLILSETVISGRSEKNKHHQQQQEVIGTDFVQKLHSLKSEKVIFQFFYLVNVMACEPLGIQYLSNKKDFLQEAVWSILESEPEFSQKFDKIAIAIFQKFSLKKKYCLQMLKFGISEWLLKLLDELKSTQQYEIQYGLALLMNLTLHRQKAKDNGLQKLMEKKLQESQNDQLLTQIRHILSKIDEFENEQDYQISKHMKDQDQIIEEENEDDDDSPYSLGSVPKSLKKQDQTQTKSKEEDEEIDWDDDDEQMDFNDNEVSAEIEDEEDDNMSISYFSDDVDFNQYKVGNADPITYFENRMLKNQIFQPFNNTEQKAEFQSQPTDRAKNNQSGLYTKRNDKPIFSYNQSQSNNNPSSSGTVIIGNAQPNDRQSIIKFIQTIILNYLHKFTKIMQNIFYLSIQLILQKEYDIVKTTKKPKSKVGSNFTSPDLNKPLNNIPKVPYNQNNFNQNIINQAKLDLNKLGEDILRNEFSLKKDTKRENFEQQQDSIKPDKFYKNK
ncbi:UNKNOWN [Stylonychia lemnae]|uniref:LisH domain-containing protein n=1 Tax=Stylonychia lemnae TaxID=5949 RepID=A0A078A637_STYLE|nr:UNKNOWN [Stylonychia lemnae]|eukprot:CDW77020.1 UNKNOWN [Stylonychia lemnae]